MGGRASGRDGGGVMNRPPSPLTMRFSRHTMRRREVITLLGGALGWPLTAGAQTERMRRVAVLNTVPSDDGHGQERIGAFLQALQQAGWSIGGNLRIDQRWALGDDALRKSAADLVALVPDAILATGGIAVRPLLAN